MRLKKYFKKWSNVKINDYTLKERMYIDNKAHIILLDIGEVIPITNKNHTYRESYKWYFRVYIDEKKWSDVDERDVITNIRVYKLLKAKHRLAKNKNRWKNSCFSL